VAFQTAIASCAAFIAIVGTVVIGYSHFTGLVRNLAISSTLVHWCSVLQQPAQLLWRMDVNANGKFGCESVVTGDRDMRLTGGTEVHTPYHYINIRSASLCIPWPGTSILRWPITTRCAPFYIRSRAT
jgi:hypothetical protein